VKLYAIIAGLILLAGGIGYGVHIVRKASRVDQAEARAEAAEKGRASDMAEVVKRLDADKAWREGFAAKFDAIDAKFDSIKIPDPKVLVQTREVPGACPVTGVSSEFLRLYNQASEP
jgi:hypothetical protein